MKSSPLVESLNENENENENEGEKPGQGHVKVLAHETTDEALREALEDIERLPILTGRSVAVRILAPLE